MKATTLIILLERLKRYESNAPNEDIDIEIDGKLVTIQSTLLIDELIETLKRHKEMK